MKTKTRGLALIIMILAGVAWGFPAWAGEESPRVSQWMGLEGKPLHPPLIPYPVWTLETAAPDLRMTGGLLEADQGRVCIVVSQEVYPEMTSSLLQYQADLYVTGFTSIVHVFSSGGAESLRDHLAMLYEEEESLAGAVLIGDIPYIVYEMMQTWVTGGTAEYEDFPCDLFYMDLDGVWSDSLDEGSVKSGNGKYDTREGDLGLEIWVSRVRTDNLSLLGSETELMISYFDKNHRYRKQELMPGQEALVYNDDDWDYMAASDADKIGWVYGDSQVTAIFDPEETTAADFKANQLTAPFEFMSLRSHGWTGGHGFYRNGSVFERVYSSDYEAIDPDALFYSLFVCSGSDYTAGNNLAGAIAFNPEDSGLLTVGTTKTGGMWNESLFYTALSNQASFGEAFRQWLNSVMDRSDAPRWWYGMVLMGDGALMRSNFMDYPCLGDSEGDGDVDGTDLASFALSNEGSSSLDLFLFAENFRKMDCP